MKELVEFRIPERNAAQYLPANVGECVGDEIRKVVVSVDDPLFDEIGRLHREFRERNEYFFFGRVARRTYTKRELVAAQLFHLWPQRTFEPAGEECGTTYDESTACPVCGGAATQVSELRLDLRKMPASDFAETIAGERVVSQRFAECLIDASLKGFKLTRVSHKARHEDDSIDLDEVPAGRALLQNAERAGMSHPTWSFWVWANRSENRPLLDQARVEHAAKRRSDDLLYRGVALPIWYQLEIDAPAVELSPLTRAGEDPFDFEGTGKCPLGHLIGLNLLSEVTVVGGSMPKADFLQTKQMIGVRRGLLRPRPILLATPRACRAIESQKLKGVMFEIARIA